MAKITQKVERVLSEGVKRSAKIYYFYSREGILNCEGVEINSLDENFFFTKSNELYSLKDVCCYDNNQPLFFVYRGFNFATRLVYNNKDNCFKEHKYDDDYMIMCRQSQVFKRAFGMKKILGFKFFLNLILTLTLTTLSTILIYWSIIFLNS